MDAITKNWISEEQIQQMTDQALGHPVAIKNISLCISQLERAKESTGTGQEWKQTAAKNVER